MRIVEASAERLAVEETGSGFGLACVLAGHGIALMPLAFPTWNWWTAAIEAALGVAVALYGAIALTATRVRFDRRAGAVVYAQKNFFRARGFEARFNEIEDVLLQRSAREPASYAHDATIDPEYAYRVVLRVRGQRWALSRGYHEYRIAQPVAAAIRALLDEWALNSLRRADH